MSEKQIIRIYWGAIIVATVVIVGIITSAFLLNPSEELLPTYALAELYVSALAFLVVWLTLVFIIVQLRKSMAKPKLSLAFSEDGKTETTIEIKPNQSADHKLRLWVINTGNAISELFQIDTEIPQIFHHGVESNTVNSVHRRTHGDNRIVSFINKHEYVCFVNIPTPIPNLVLHTTINEYNEYSSRLVIKYKIYGDWAETQEGELKVNINKQEQ